MTGAREPDGPIDGDPRHDLRRHEVATPAAHFPDALIREHPTRGDDVDDPAQQVPERIGDLATRAVIQPRRVEQVPVGIELELLGGRVADAHRLRSAIPVQPVEVPFGDVALASDPVHDLEILSPARGGAFDPTHERVGFLGVAEREQRVEVECGVAQPAVPVVPVANASDRFGK